MHRLIIAGGRGNQYRDPSADGESARGYFGWRGKKGSDRILFPFAYLYPLCSDNFSTQLIAPWLQASLSKTNSATTTTTNSVDKQMAENLAQDMSDLMHDFDVVSRINSMVRRKIHWFTNHLLIYLGGKLALHVPWLDQRLHGVDHGSDPAEHPAEGRRDVLAGQELSAPGRQEERQDRDPDVPGWCTKKLTVRKTKSDGDVTDAVASGEAGLGS